MTDRPIEFRPCCGPSVSKVLLEDDVPFVELFIVSGAIGIPGPPATVVPLLLRLGGGNDVGKVAVIIGLF